MYYVYTYITDIHIFLSSELKLHNKVHHTILIKFPQIKIYYSYRVYFLVSTIFSISISHIHLYHIFLI